MYFSECPNKYCNSVDFMRISNEAQTIKAKNVFANVVGRIVWQDQITTFSKFLLIFTKSYFQQETYIYMYI